MAESSVVIKSVDETESGLKSAARNIEQLKKKYSETEKEAGKFAQKQQELNELYAKQKTALHDVTQDVKELQKAHKEAADDKNTEEALTNAIIKQKEYQDALKSTKKEIDSLTKSSREMGRTSKSSSNDTLKSWNVALSGIGKQLGSAVSGYATQYMTSALGSKDSAAISNVLSGVLSGAAAGAVAGPAGAAVGAVVGAASGVITTLAQEQQKEDAAMQSYRDSIVTNVTQSGTESLTGGSATAATREQNRLAFANLLGSDVKAGIQLAKITDLANRTPYLYDDLVTVAKQLIVYGYGKEKGKKLGQTLTTIGDAGAAIGWSTSDQAQVAQYLGFMGTMQKVETEQLKSLQQRGLSVYDWLADYYGVSNSQFQEMVTNGDVQGSTAASVILSRMASQYGGSMEAQSQTFAGLTSTIEGLTGEMDAAKGAGYNSERMEGLEKQVSFLSGDTADSIKDAYRIIGEGNAAKDNREDEIYREVMGAVFGGESPTTLNEETVEAVNDLRDRYEAVMSEYDTASEQRKMELGAEMQNIMDESEALATGAQDVDESLKEWRDKEIELIDKVGEYTTALGGYEHQMELAIAQSKGTKAYVITIDASKTGSSGAVPYGDRAASFAPTVGTGTTSAGYGAVGYGDRAASFGRAVGQHVIPYDGYPIRAHQGEMLLTAQEAREYQAGGRGVQISFAGANFTVRQESDIDAIADAIATRLQMAEAIAR